MEQQPPNNSPGGVMIRVLSMFGGLMAATCFTVFLGMAFRSETAMLVTSIAFIIVALIVNRCSVNLLFLDTSIITLYVVGCSVLCYLMVDGGWNVHLNCFLFVLLALFTLFFSRGFILPFLAVVMLNAVLFVWFIVLCVQQRSEISLFVVLPGVVFFILTCYESLLIMVHPIMKRLMRPLHAGFFFSFSCALVWVSDVSAFLGRLSGSMVQSSFAVIPSLFIWVGVVLMVRQVMKTIGVKRSKTQVLVYVACFALLIPTLFAPSLLGALLLLLLCFGYGYKVEMGASLLLLLYAVSKYYYDLELTLLVKSGTLFLTGVILLLAYYYFTKQAKDKN